ncbi:MAG: amino acid racemase [Bacteroidota bacterium]
MNFNEKVIGVVGGMGPQAGADLLSRIFKLTKAGKDQHHKSVILMSFPKHIADRTDFIEGKVEVNPAINISKIIIRLETCGADVVGIACNSSHAPEIYDRILEELDKAGCRVQLLHMPKETCRFIKDKYPSISRVGVMVTNGAYQSGVYQGTLESMGLKAIVPGYEFQDQIIHRMIYHPIYGIKSHAQGIRDEVKILLDKALHFFRKEQVEALILGCTELSLVLDQSYVRDIPIIDSNEILAKALIRESESYDQPEISGKNASRLTF